MRLVRYAIGGQARIGVPVDGGFIDIDKALNGGAQREAMTSEVLAFLDQPPARFKQAETQLGEIEGRLSSGTSHALRHDVFVAAATATVLPPVVPRRVLCTWVNYGQTPMTAKPMSEPLFFCKFAESLIGAEAEIVLPSTAERVIVEPELAVVIGKEGRNILEDAAFEHVAGYTILNDVTALDYTLESFVGTPGPYLMGKNFATFAPIGPWLVTPGDVLDPHRLRVRSWLDGQLAIDTSTQGMHYSLPRVLSYLSRFFALLPGDIISMGCPARMPGARMDVRRFLQAGDRVRIEIEGLGTQTSTVVSERSTESLKRYSRSLVSEMKA